MHEGVQLLLTIAYSCSTCISVSCTTVITSSVSKTCDDLALPWLTLDDVARRSLITDLELVELDELVADGIHRFRLRQKSLGKVSGVFKTTHI